MRSCRCCSRKRSSTRIAQTVANRKLALVLLAGFAALALVLASLGVYSVMAHLVAFRTSEIGLRMALGASPAAVMRMVLGHGRRLTLVGIAFGIAGALVVSRLMQQALFEVDPADPLVYVAVSVTLAARGRVRLVLPGPARDEDRSGDCAADRVTRPNMITFRFEHRDAHDVRCGQLPSISTWRSASMSKERSGASTWRPRQLDVVDFSPADRIPRAAGGVS